MLVRSGVRVSPFNFHEIKEPPAFTEEKWTAWLRRMLCKYDGSLNFDAQKSDPTPQIEKIKDYDYSHLSTLDWVPIQDEWIEIALQTYNEQLSQYHQALLDWGSSVNDIPLKDTIPPDLWLNEDEFKQDLYQLYEEFRVNKYDTVSSLSKSLFPHLNIISPTDGLHVYF